MEAVKNKSQERLENYRKDHLYLTNLLAPERAIEVNGKIYNTIKDRDIYDVFEYFFADADKKKCEAYFESFINQNLKKHDLIKVFLEDGNGVRKTEFNRTTKKFNGQKTANISELYFCRESFLKAGWFIGLLQNTGHLIGSNKAKTLKILAKINEIKELSYPKIIEGLIELKSVANGEEICKPFEFGEDLQVQKVEEKAERTEINYEEFLKKNFWPLHEAVSLVVGDVPTGDNFHTRNLLTYKRASEAIESGVLEAETKELWFKPLEGVEGYNSVCCVQPRTFMKWYIESEGESAPKELLKFFNYDYWLSKEYWTFDELTFLFLSESEPPFPHKITNVFEINEELNQSAKKLAQGMLNTQIRRIDEEWLYWRLEKVSKGRIGITRFCPNSVEDFRKERVYLKITALFRVIKNHKNHFLSIPSVLYEKALEMLAEQDIDSLHFSHTADYLVRMIREDSLQNSIGKICSYSLFLRALAKLPVNERNFEILKEISLQKIPYSSEEKISDEGKQTLSDINGIKARFENLDEYTFLFEKDCKLNKITFLSGDEDGNRGRVIDFIEWARGHNIIIPHGLIGNGSESSKITESVDAVAQPSKTLKAEVTLIETNHKICVMALEALKKDELCDLEIDSATRLWNLIISLCDEDLDRFDDLHNSKKRPDKEKLSKIRKEIKNNLSLTELFFNRDDREDGELQDTDYYFCWKTIESMKPKKGRAREEAHPITFGFRTFRNNFSKFKNIISSRN